MKKFFTPLLIFLLSCTTLSGAGRSALDEWKEFSRSPGGAELIDWLIENSRLYLNGSKLKFQPPVELPELNGRAGMFITLIKKGKVRGCYGAFYHESGDTALIFLNYLKRALYLDPRYKPLEPSELDETEIIVTVTSFPEPVDDLNNVDIEAFGVFIECGDPGGTVIVPAEFRTVSRISSLVTGHDCRYSRFRAVTIRKTR